MCEQLGFSLNPEEGAEISTTLAPALTFTKDHTSFNLTYAVNADSAGSSAVKYVNTKVSRYVWWDGAGSEAKTFQTSPQYTKSSEQTEPGKDTKCQVWAIDSDHTYSSATLPSYYYRCEVVGYVLQDDTVVSASSTTCPFSATVSVVDGKDCELADGTSVQAVYYDAINEAQVGTMTVNVTTKSYDVAFNSDGGSYEPTTQSVQFGQKVTKPETPTKTGYVLEGWYTNDTTPRM